MQHATGLEWGFLLHLVDSSLYYGKRYIVWEHKASWFWPYELFKLQCHNSYSFNNRSAHKTDEENSKSRWEKAIIFYYVFVAVNLLDIAEIKSQIFWQLTTGSGLCSKGFKNRNHFILELSVSGFCTNEGGVCSEAGVTLYQTQFSVPGTSLRGLILEPLFLLV